jgi:polygalacturonase
VKKIAVLVGLAVIVLIGLVAPQAGATPVRAPAHATAKAAAATFNVRSYGAKGDGSANDTSAINAAITAANSAGGGVVEFPSGTYKSANSIHMKSNVTLQLDSGSTIQGASGTGYDKPESNAYDQYQDYGHSHFHNAMIWGDRLTNIGFTGSGTIDGGDHLITGNPDSGQADKIISLTRCTDLTLSGITLRRGGHFAALINGCDHVTSDHLTIDTASDRDGWNIISTTNVTITNANISANDDALPFKSDYALGAKLPNGHVTVTDSRLSAGCCNALMFGSETCGDFSDYNFSNITITGADKSGLGMVSMDGANISDVHYRDITMSNVHSPIMLKIGTRKRCGNSPGVGHIGPNITFDNVTGVGNTTDYSPTIWGQSGSNHVNGVTFNNVNLTVPGGHGTMGTGVPSDSGDYNPKSLGTRPAYGWYLHNADNIKFTGSSVKFAKNDGRPAVIANTGSNIAFDHFTAQRGSDSPADMIFQSISGYCVSNSANTSGGALRITNTSSTQTCATPPPPNRHEAEDATYSAGSTVDSNHAGFSGTGFVNTPNAAGSYVEWTVNAAQAGNATVTIAYANGQASGQTVDRPTDVTVNGALVKAAQSFPGTPNWDTWQTVTLTVPLVAGANTVRLTATTANGAPNLDYLDGPA